MQHPRGNGVHLRRLQGQPEEHGPPLRLPHIDGQRSSRMTNPERGDCVLVLDEGKRGGNRSHWFFKSFKWARSCLEGLAFLGAARPFLKGPPNNYQGDSSFQGVCVAGCDVFEDAQMGH